MVLAAVPFDSGRPFLVVCVVCAGALSARPWRGETAPMRVRARNLRHDVAPSPLSRLSCRPAGYDRPSPTSRKCNVIDRLREQIQQRLDQLTHEADRLRKALAALDPRSSGRARAQACRAQSPPGLGAQAEGVGDEERTGPANKPACGSLSSPDGARRDQGVRARGARWRRGDDRGRGGRQDRPRARDGVDDAVEARQERRGAEGRARLPARRRRAPTPPRRRSSTPASSCSRARGGATVPSCSRSASGST